MSQNEEVSQEKEVSDKEYNFRALESQFKQERAMRLDAEQKSLQDRQAKEELEKRWQQEQDRDDDSDSLEPYVDDKKLEKKLAKYDQKNKQYTQNEIKNAVQSAIYEERKSNWMSKNSDFYEVMKHANKFAETVPELAESILQMPEGFERQKLVYANIKTLGLHQNKPPASSIQDKIDTNRRSHYYQPSGVSHAPGGMGGNYSEAGQKESYKQMQELKGLLHM